VPARFQKSTRYSLLPAPGSVTRAMRFGVAASISAFCVLSLSPWWIAVAQQPTFEVVSIRLNKSGVPPNGNVSEEPGRFLGTNASAKLLIREAYSIKDYQLSGGPGWLDSDRFDIEAKAGTASGDAELRAMLRTLLTERFKLVLHHETKEMSVYNLLVGKGGVKFPEVKPGAPRPPSPRLLENVVRRLRATRFSALADLLSSPQLLGKPVIDKTGLTGNYLIDMQSGPDEDLQGVLGDYGLRV